MRQLSQNYRTGDLAIEEVPPPTLGPGFVLVRTGYSLISSGTERTKVEMGQKSLLGKARARPDLVQKTLDKVRTEGLVKTVQTVLTRLDTPTPLGYSSAGTVLEAAGDAAGLPPGTRVACGGEHAVHAEVICVPKNLCVPLPEGVDLRQAAAATLGAIALQGVRQANLRLGESAVVVGLGLVGQLSCQLLRAAGCKVIGVDLDPSMAKLARQSGADQVLVGDGEEVAAAVAGLTGGRGADATLLCAGTSSDGPMFLAGQVTRDRGVVVAVGLVGMNVPREAFYQKELTLRLSRSYGPGRYDPAYEEKGQDYPYGYVRWTEARNMACFLGLLATGQVRLGHVLTHDFPFERALDAYRLLTERSEPFVGITLSYPQTPSIAKPVIVNTKGSLAHPKTIGVGVIGAGNYLQATLLPILKRHPQATMIAVATASGLTAKNAARKFGFTDCAPSAEAVLADPRVNLVVIGTRHDSHARLASLALRAGKDVHVEKPLALSAAELAEVRQAAVSSSGRLMVGFNRRFAEATVAAREFLTGAVGPRLMTCRVNAGRLPSDHWLLDPEVGGGRLLGEGCHFVDLLCFLAESPARRVLAMAGRSANAPKSPRQFEDVSVLIEFANGSAATLVYSSCGDSSVPKERIEIMVGGRHVIIDDFRSVTLASRGRQKTRRSRAGDKGQAAMIDAEIGALLSGSSSSMPYEGLENATLATLAIIESLRIGAPVEPVNLAAVETEPDEVPSPTP